ncbi:MAG: PDZ domain-containing protein [Pirellula sp.]|nr:PDZ domain-containing protein [Pirellula sp.]
MKRVIQRSLGVFLVGSLASFCVLDLIDQSRIDGSALTLAIGTGGARGSTEEGNSLLVQQGPGTLGREFQNFTDRAHQRTHRQTLRAFQDSVGDAYKSTVQIIVRNRQAALGAIVHPDGWIVSKASEVPEKFDVKLWDQTKAIGQVRARLDDMDLVLIKIERSGLQPIRWGTSEEIPVGGWLISTDLRATPLTIGVLSVANRNIRKEKAVLGVRLGSPPGSELGAIIESVVDGGGADRAGLRVGDIIQSIEGVAYSSMDEVLSRLRELKAGQTVALDILRDDRKVSIAAQMMDLTSSLFDSTEMEVNGQISARATGFQNVMQHDTVLLPHQCGGPIVDVEGRVIGLNIARSGRVSSFAYHAKNLEPAIRNLMRNAGGPDEVFVDAPAVVQASAVDGLSSSSSAVSIPTSVPTAIQVESLKPEVVLPSPM